MRKDVKQLSQKLKRVFQKMPINAVYLYGSQASGKADKLSDYDFGILFSENTDKNKRFDLILDLFGDIARAIKVSEDLIDVVDLRNAPLLLRFNAIRGIAIYLTDDTSRVDFETYIMARYADEHYYLDRFLHETITKIEKGVFFDRRLSYP